MSEHSIARPLLLVRCFPNANHVIFMHTYARAEDEISKGLFPRDLHCGKRTYKLKRFIVLKATIQHFLYLKRTMRE